MNHLALVFLIILTGCSHQREFSKTVQFPYAEELLKKIQLKAPSRITSKDESHEPLVKSPRRVYFSSLYNQYLVLGQILHKKNDIIFCPQFHHDKTLAESRLPNKIDFLRYSSVEEEGRDYFPESVFMRESSLLSYHQSMRVELETLCEEGVTDNFFKFDNLITHYAHKSSFHESPSAMVSVLKIPVFANFYLIKMINPSGLIFSTQEERDFIKITRTYWFENYVVEASRMRNVFIKNKMVRR